MVTTRHLNGAEFYTSAKGRLCRSSARGTIWCPGGGSLDYHFVAPDADEAAVNARDLVDIITGVDRDRPILSLNTQFLWGNDASMTKVDNLYAWAVALGYPTQVDLVGTSMGFTTACAWAKRNPTKVRLIAGIIPLTNLDDFHDYTYTSNGYAPSINAAYGSEAAYNATVATRDPIQIVTDITHIPIRVWYSTDDNLIDPAWPPAFAAAVGGQAVSMGAVGHAINLANSDGLLEFLEAPT